MNKRLLFAAFATVCGATMASTGALAQPGNGTQDTSRTTATAPANPSADKANAKRAVPAPGSRNCIRSTGSHIPAPKGECLPVAGRSYSQHDLRSTGAISVGRALEMLDPSVSIGH